MNVTSYEILRTINEPVSEKQCAIVCQNDVHCEGMLFNGMECELLNDVKIENEATKSAWIDLNLVALTSKY